MHTTAAVMINSPRHAPGGAAERPKASAAKTPRMAIPTPADLRHVSGSARSSANQHCLQRQSGERKTCARCSRVGNCDIVENEKQAEETNAQRGDGGPVIALGPARA